MDALLTARLAVGYIVVLLPAHIAVSRLRKATVRRLRPTPRLSRGFSRGYNGGVCSKEVERACQTDRPSKRPEPYRLGQIVGEKGGFLEESRSRSPHALPGAKRLNGRDRHVMRPASFPGPSSLKGRKQGSGGVVERLCFSSLAGRFSSVSGGAPTEPWWMALMI